MFESYVKRNGEKLRRGYTTGTAAAGAAKAAAETLYSGQTLDVVKVDTPAEIVVDLEISGTEIKEESVSCTVLKDGGDDADITDGTEIVAEVTKLDSGIELKGGKGVGEVTKPGLAVEVGKPAINPVPREMIIDSVKEVLPPESGAKITIKVPEGEELAANTLNPRLGVEGGISILGTTGIVEPMSKKAYRESLVVTLDQALAEDNYELVFIFGNYGKQMAQSMGVSDNQWVKMSNFVGYMLERAAEREIERIILLGHVGKLIKVGAGIFDTHSSVADARLEIVAAYTASLGGSQQLIQKILAANTAEETIQILREVELAEDVFNLLAKRVVARAAEKVEYEIDFGAILFSMDQEVVGSYGVELKKGAEEWRIKSMC
ncbi:cobalt-precorrin-5B (C(1))-methyltransferase CbiD [Acetohalobium arabaticum]|uniref:Cobalt-precorrin-5B C(1)-methyltransferase n=1 Tax=Acetohalobium arabaticum (strain ATCC 49924 / DSM 5501 / Z-7288) TaxID=574087 RepID=D9QVV7_ACEAZ|nr:cobalt-precorrin-5B (C(1))-methyltransferase CbiD [Acetohalobium arabaticum]ADL12366.1 cobalamin biosynthesis protein CbiD [Acetohalobium arabaticum DSM 5501]